MTIREIIEKSKVKKNDDIETLQNCIIALSQLIYFLSTEVKEIKFHVDGCYANTPESYLGEKLINPGYWEKLQEKGSDLVQRYFDTGKIDKNVLKETIKLI